MEKIIKFLESPQFYVSIIVIVVSLILCNIITRLTKRVVNKKSVAKGDSKRKVTYIKLINNIIKVCIALIACVIILQLFGINVSSLIAGIGVVSLVAGLALQDALKDIIMGVNVIMGNYYSVGDVIKVGEVEGKVLELGLKSTKIMDIYTGNVFVMANRNIETALTLGKELYIGIPAPYEEKMEKVNEILNEATKIIKANSMVKEAVNLGVSAFEDSSMKYLIKIICLPENRPKVNRLCLQTVKDLFDKNDIEIPYKQIVIHNSVKEK